MKIRKPDPETGKLTNSQTGFGSLRLPFFLDFKKRIDYNKLSAKMTVKAKETKK